MATATQRGVPGGFKPRFSLRVLGTPAPVFPGFEVDLSQHVDDREKPDAVWHRQRARAMLAAHPELRALHGTLPSTAAWCIVFAAAQIALALVVAGGPFWLLVLTAYVVGSWINLNLFTLAHECNHNLVFKRASWNRGLFTLTSLPMFMSGHHTFWLEHPIHHNDLGAKRDFIKRRRSFFLLTRKLSPLVMPYSLFMLVTQIIRSALGLVIYLASLLRGRLDPGPIALAVLADEHLAYVYRKQRLTRWAVLYSAAFMAMLVALYAAGGWMPIAYLLASQAFMTGFLHPLMFGMVLSNSHFHGHRRYQPTSSYYGWLNWITFNYGLHTEHHDLAGIPGRRLHRVRQIAPEFYDSLVETRSFVELTWKFAFGSQRDVEERFDNEEHRNASMLAEVGLVASQSNGPSAMPRSKTPIALSTTASPAD